MARSLCPRSVTMEEPHEIPRMADPCPINCESDIPTGHLETPPPEEGLAQSALVALSGNPPLDPSRIYGTLPGSPLDGDYILHQHEQNVDRVVDILIPVALVNSRTRYFIDPVSYDYLALRYSLDDYFYRVEGRQFVNRTILDTACGAWDSGVMPLVDSIYRKHGCEPTFGDWPVPQAMSIAAINPNAMRREACQDLMRTALTMIYEQLPKPQIITSVGHSMYML